MRMRFSAAILLGGLLAVAGGCQRLNFEKTVNLDSMGVHQFELDAPAYQQKVSVTITPVSAGVSAYLIKASDLAALTAALDKEKEPAASILLGSHTSKGAAETYTFEATVPAKTAYTLLLRGTKSTEVKVKLVGR